MQISTNQFLLGSVADLLSEESGISQLNRQIATGQAMLDATTDPAGAGAAIGLAGEINRLGYDSGNAQAATQQIQSGLGVLQQVASLLDQLRQTALAGANAGNSPATNQALTVTAQNGLQQLLALANAQDGNGHYIFAGTRSDAAPFETLPNGAVVFAGDAGANLIEIAPSLTVPVSISGQSVFDNIPAGENGVTITAAATNNGTAYATVPAVTSSSQLDAERLAGTQFAIAFSAGPGGSLNYSVTSGPGSPGTSAFSAGSTILASGPYVAGSDLQFGGLNIAITGTPAAGDRFVVEPGGTSSLFETVQGLISALGSAASNPQQIENAIANLDGAQTNILAAEARLGASLATIQAIAGASSTQSTNAAAQLSDLQSADLPQVLATYSASLTALQASEQAFARISNLSLFSLIQ